MAKATAIDIGSHASKALVLRTSKKGLALLRFSAQARDGGDADLAALGVPLLGAIAGLAGRDMTLRYTQVPPTPDWQLKNLMELEIQDLAQQSGGELSADFNLLPVRDEEGGTETVLMALARNDALARQEELVRAAGGTIAGHVPNCVALYNAYLRCGPVDPDAVVGLMNIGHETIDIALVRGMDLLFARNLSGGSKVLDDAIGLAFNVSARKAESLKRDLLDLDPASRGHFASGQAEKVTMSAIGAAGSVIAAMQSSVAFCKAQTKIQDLKLDKVLICGGGSRVRGLRALLRESLRCPVEAFDPFQSVDTSALPPADLEQLNAFRAEAVVALGLAAGKLDPELYALEILPERIKRRQRFAQRTIYNIAAGLAAAVLLAVLAVGERGRLAAATTAQTRLRQEKQRLESTHTSASKVIGDNQSTRALLEELALRGLPRDGVLMAMRALHDTLPPEAWITRVEVKPQAQRGKGSAPVVELSGAVKPVAGTDVGSVYRDFNKNFRAHPLIRAAGFTAEQKDTSEQRSTFTFTIDFQPPAPPK
jgi:type IV pilus assembly protein PilM